MFFRSYIISTVLLFISFPAISDEIRERERVSSTSIVMMLQDQFALVDETARMYRENEDRFASGIWKLSSFYGGFAGFVSSEVKNERRRQDMDDTTAQFLKEYPSSPSAVIIRALYYNSVAWGIRGGGLARDVTPLGWRGFNENLKKAALFLENNKEIGKVDPHWYDLLARVYWSMNDKNNALAIQSEGIESFPDYYPLYFTAMTYLSPRWYGDAELMERFANYAVSQTQEFEGTSLYVRTYWSVSNFENREGGFFEGSQMDWMKMRRSMYDVLERYPAEWNIQNFAYFACAKGDAEMAGEMLDMIEDEPFRSVWRKSISFEECREIADR